MENEEKSLNEPVNEVSVTTTQPKKRAKREGALFVVSLVMACIALVLFAIGIVLDFAFTDLLNEGGAIVILLIVFFAVPIIVGIASEVFAIISLTNASILFKRVKKPKSIVMFIIGLVEIFFLPIIIALLVILAH